VYNEKSLTYGELEALTNSVALTLKSVGVKRGDRVGIYVGILKTGASYVPLDPNAPLQRIAFIIRDSEVKVLLTSSAKLADVRAMFPENCPLGSVLLIDSDVPKQGELSGKLSETVSFVSWRSIRERQGVTFPEDQAIETDTAFILYTSGSTGTPKGVMISHRNSLSFVNWAADCAGLSSEDRVTSHAPLHFDLSTFDIFSSVREAATIIIVPENAAMFPVQLTKLLERERITVTYLVPSVLTLLVLYGNIPAHDLSRLRAIIFAGEVFPAKYLSKLMSLLPKRRYMNWYGPTETNVCTYYEVRSSDSTRVEPVPIGKACANTDVFALSKDGRVVEKPGERGELYVRGPTLMQGYWKQQEKTARVLVPNPLHQKFSELVYRTGDIVTLDAEGNYVFLGREDGMVKTRGYRVELGEIEAVLYQHPSIKEAAVLPVPDEILGNRLRAVVSLHDNAALNRNELAAFCAQKLPSYMVPDVFEFRTSLPKTSTGKTDRVTLALQSPN
jgi:amino acid adenylation domain-containing protein